MLTIELRINGKLIEQVNIVNMEPWLDERCTPVCNYEVKRENGSVYITHDRRDGANALAAKALMALQI